ncbi:MAG: hypothetical protein IT307_07650 [Chloroflexi bacterium]|nr:hypothetical protein [Chloroflexota bacterium]
MNGVRAALLGLSMLVAIAPAAALAKENEKDNEAWPGMGKKTLQVTCDQSTGVVTWTFNVKNRGKVAGDFIADIRVDTGNHGKLVLERKILNVGPVSFAAGETQTVSGSTTVSTPGPTFAEVRAHVTRPDNDNLEVSQKKKVRCQP